VYPCPDQLFSGSLLEGSNRGLSFLECPDQMTTPATIAQLKSARERQVKTNDKKPIVVFGKTKVVRSA